MPGIGRVKHVERQPGGASQETWRVVLDADVVIVRRSAGGAIFDYGVDRRFEYSVLNRMHAAGVPVPQPIACTDDLLGHPVIAMQWMEGESIGSRVVRTRTDWARPEELLEGLVRSLVLIQIEPDGFAFPIQRGAPHPALDEVDRMRLQLDRLDHPYPATKLALRWLERHPPLPAMGSIVRGDFRVGNLLITSTGSLNGVLDWEFVHLGDPIEDLGWFCVKAWRFGAVEREAGGLFRRDLVAAYERVAGRTVDPSRSCGGRYSATFVGQSVQLPKLGATCVGCTATSSWR